MDEMVGKRVLITAGNGSGRTGHVAYTFYRHVDGFCQMEAIEGLDWDHMVWIVPDFDHWGTPKIIERKEGEFVFMPEKQ